MNRVLAAYVLPEPPLFAYTIKGTRDLANISKHNVETNSIQSTVTFARYAGPLEQMELTHEKRDLSVVLFLFHQMGKRSYPVGLIS